MKIKSSYLYQINDMKRPVTIFYIVIMSILILFAVSAGLSAAANGNVSFGSVSISSSSGGYSSGSFSGLEGATVIFLFVCGLNFFKELFRMFIQNGVSRKTMFVGRILTILSICATMAVIDKIILLLGKFVFEHLFRMSFTGMFEMIYSPHVVQIGNLQMHIEGLLFNLCFYLAAITFGYFVSVAFYRMSNIVKIIVGIGTIAILFNGLPMLDAILLNGAIMKAIMNAISFSFGFQNGCNPFFGMVTFILTSAVFAALSWLLMRKAAVKE